ALSCVLATSVAGGVAWRLRLAGPGWPLRGAFLVFVIGTLMAFHLPHKVDSAKGEQRAGLHAEGHGARSAHAMTGARRALLHAEGHGARSSKAILRTVGPSVILALRGVSSLRWLVGFLVMFL